jgi:hypothetical protein
MGGLQSFWEGGVRFERTRPHALQAPRACSIVLRGASKDVLNEVERNLQVGAAVFLSAMLAFGCWHQTLLLSTFLCRTRWASRATL